MNSLDLILPLLPVFGAVLIDRSVKIKSGIDEDLRSRANLYDRDDLVIPSEVRRSPFPYVLGWALVILSALSQAYLLAFKLP